MRTGKIETPTIINKMWSVIYDSGELGAATSSISITGLNGDVDEEYIIIGRVINATTNSSVCGIRPNGDSNNYGYQRLSGNNTTIDAAQDTATSYFRGNGGNNNVGEISMFEGILYAKSGYLRSWLSKDLDGVVTTTITQAELYGGVWNNTADNITSLTIFSGQTNGLGIGSRFILLKKVTLTTGIKSGTLNIQGKISNAWQKIYETTLGAAAASLTISNLNGDTDVLYRLTGRIVNNSGGVTYYSGRINGDNTTTNYGRQRIKGQDTTASANRYNTFYFIDDQNVDNNEICHFEYLLYAKSGYLRTGIIKTVAGIATTVINALTINGWDWNNTADNITSLGIVADNDNGLGVGSYFKLERLNL